MSEVWEAARIRVETDPVEPDWRFRLLMDDAVVGEVAEAAADVGIATEGEEAAEIARLLNEVRLGG